MGEIYDRIHSKLSLDDKLYNNHSYKSIITYALKIWLEINLNNSCIKTYHKGNYLEVINKFLEII